MLNKERGLHTCRALTVVKHKLNCPRQSSLLVLLPLLLNAGFALSQTVNVDASINVDVSMSNQTFEGWGTSLSWSANSVGGWTNRTNQKDVYKRQLLCIVVGSAAEISVSFPEPRSSHRTAHH